MNENVYFECRKRAAIHNERLNSRAGAAEILGISESTLAHYELGITKNIPVDVVVMMAEVYNAPELKCIYCKSECPIGKELPIATEAGTIEGITVRMLSGLEDEKIDKIQKTLLRIAEDGKVEAAEREELKEMVQSLDSSVSETVKSGLSARMFGDNGLCSMGEEEILWRKIKKGGASVMG